MKLQIAFAVTAVFTFAFARADGGSNQTFIQSVKTLTALETTRVKNPYLDYLEKSLKSSASSAKSVHEQIKLISEAEEKLHSRGERLPEGSPISAHATLKLAEILVRNIGIFKAVRVPLAHIPELKAENEFIEEQLRLAERLLAASKIATEAGETERLQILKSFQLATQKMNETSMLRTKGKIARVQAEDVEFERANPDPEARDRKLLNDYVKRIDEISIGKHVKAGLTDSERLAISLYTEGAYLNVNEALWAAKPSTFEGFTRLLDQALAKLPKYSGVVHRKTRLSTAQLVDYEEGRDVLIPAYISTSIDNGYSSNAPVHLIIQSKTGREITPYSYHLTEKEVLFPAGLRFQIVKRIEHPGGKFDIWMQEI